MGLEEQVMGEGRISAIEQRLSRMEKFLNLNRQTEAATPSPPPPQTHFQPQVPALYGSGFLMRKFPDGRQKKQSSR